MWDFNFSQIFSLMKQTYPFLVFRFTIYTAITGIAIALTGGGAGLGWIGGSIFGEVGSGVLYGGFFGASIASYFLYVIREYLLYQVKAGHIALLVKLMHNEPIPNGNGMVEYGKNQVKEHFTESNVLFAVDQLIKGVLKVISGTFNSLGNMIPIPGVANLIKVINKIVSMSLTYVDEIILAFHMKNASNNVWNNSSRGLVLFAQNYPKILKNAFWVSLLTWGLTFCVFLFVLAPIAIFTAAVPSLAGPWTFIVAALLAWGVKSAIVDPIAMTALMHVYFKAIEGQSPSWEWERRLETLSAKFRTLKEKGKTIAAENRNAFSAEFRKASAEASSKSVVS